MKCPLSSLLFSSLSRGGEKREREKREKSTNQKRTIGEKRVIGLSEQIIMVIWTRLSILLGTNFVQVQTFQDEDLDETPRG